MRDPGLPEDFHVLLTLPLPSVLFPHSLLGPQLPSQISGLKCSPCVISESCMLISGACGAYPMELELFSQQHPALRSPLL